MSETLYPNADGAIPNHNSLGSRWRTFRAWLIRLVIGDWIVIANARIEMVYSPQGLYFASCPEREPGEYLLCSRSFFVPQQNYELQITRHVPADPSAWEES